MSRTSKDIDMKPRPLSKLDKRNTAISEKIDENIVTYLSLLQFMANLL